VDVDDIRGKVAAAIGRRPGAHAVKVLLDVFLLHCVGSAPRPPITHFMFGSAFFIPSVLPIRPWSPSQSALAIAAYTSGEKTGCPLESTHHASSSFQSSMYFRRPSPERPSRRPPRPVADSRLRPGWRNSRRVMTRYPPQHAATTDEAPMTVIQVDRPRSCRTEDMVPRELFSLSIVHPGKRSTPSRRSPRAEGVAASDVDARGGHR
jgi:hypothetical protein